MSFHRSPEEMRRFYDGFQPWYGFIEGNTGRAVRRALETLEPGQFEGGSLLEHGCGSAALGLEVAGRFSSYEGRDQSEGMLGRARGRWAARYGADSVPRFSRESVLELDDPPGSFDWTAVAFALHLFPPGAEEAILAALLRVARRGLLVVEHGRRSSALVSLVEAMEGSWYEDYKRVDFAAVAERLGAADPANCRVARLQDRELRGTRALLFLKR
jgi:hypothetical protein